MGGLVAAARARELGVQPFPELTDREREVLEELVAAKSKVM